MAKNAKQLLSGCTRVRSASSRTKPQDWVHMGEVCIFGLGLNHKIVQAQIMLQGSYTRSQLKRTRRILLGLANMKHKVEAIYTP